MSTFLFCLHVSAALLIGHNAYQRGRSFIVWTALTLIPYAIFVTWPLLYILPRLKRTSLAPAAPALIDLRPASTPSNRSFYVGVTVWIGVLLVLSVAMMAGIK